MQRTVLLIISMRELVMVQAWKWRTPQHMEPTAGVQISDPKGPVVCPVLMLGTFKHFCNTSPMHHGLHWVGHS